MSICDHQARIREAALFAVAAAVAARPERPAFAEAEVQIRALGDDPRFGWLTARIVSEAVDAEPAPLGADTGELRLFAASVVEACEAVRWAYATVGVEGPSGVPLTELDLICWRQRAEACVAALERWARELSLALQETGVSAESR